MPTFGVILADGSVQPTVSNEIRADVSTADSRNSQHHLTNFRELFQAELQQEEANCKRIHDDLMKRRQYSREVLASITTMLIENEAAEDRMLSQLQASHRAYRARIETLISQYEVHDAKRSTDIDEMKKEFNMRLEQRKEEFQMKDDEAERLELKAEEKLKRAANKTGKNETGMPKKPLTLYNIHVMEEKKRLEASGCNEDCLFTVCSHSWALLDEEQRWRRYGDLFKRDEFRFRNELERWHKEQDARAVVDALFEDGTISKVIEQALPATDMASTVKQLSGKLS